MNFIEPIDRNGRSAWGYREQNPHQDAQRRNPEWILSGHRRILRYKTEEYIADENRYVT